MKVGSFFEDRRIAVTGAAGTVGRELVRQLVGYPVKEIRALDNNESALFFLGEDYRLDPRLQVFLADIRDEKKMRHMLDGIDLIFHSAAFKHVPLCERSPFDAVQTNIMGVQNIIRAALVNKVQKVIFTSSDKAVNPTNVMGTSKLMGERLMTAANALRPVSQPPTFASTRFGNVAGSRGSVVPLFCKQIEQGGPVTLTNVGMTRFVMTLQDAVRLVISSMVLAKGGEVFITKMPVLAIKDLAEVMIRLIAPAYGREPNKIEITEVGNRPGEKLYEELMNDEETRRSFDLDEFFAVLPAFRSIYGETDYKYESLPMSPARSVYNSANVPTMNESQIEEFLLLPNVLPDNVRTLLLKEKADL